MRAQDEIRRIRIDEENELKNRSKITKLKKNREEAKRPPSNSPIEGEAGRSFTPMSDNMSYREKIRDRFNTVKVSDRSSISAPHTTGKILSIFCFLGTRRRVFIKATVTFSIQA